MDKNPAIIAKRYLRVNIHCGQAKKSQAMPGSFDETWKLIT